MTTMLPYIGTKNVLARPMTRGTYNEYQGWIIPHDQDPEDEGYLIEYLDGGKGNHPNHENYISWSPKDVFERSYVQQPTALRGKTAALISVDESPFVEPMTISKMEPLENDMALGTVEQLSNVNGQLDFSDALRALKFGYRVQRSGWNAKDQWLAVSNPESAVVEAANFWSPHSRVYAERNGGSAVVPPCILIKNAQGEIQMGWAPSPGDMFANDWVVIEEIEEAE